MNMSRSDLLNRPHLLKLIDPQDQLKLGLIQPLPEPNSKPPTKTTSPTASTGKPELQSHAEFLAWIKKLNRSLPVSQPLLAIHCDPTQPATIIPGWPDFSLFWHADFRPLFIEFKRNHKAKLSPAQQLIHSYLHSLGHHVITLVGSHQAITVTTNHFKLRHTRHKEVPFIDART